MTKDKKRYCICRSKESSGFMICCEKCEEWFHGKCVHITKKQSEGINEYYCDECKKKNPSLRITYTEKKPEATTTVKTEPLEPLKQEKKVVFADKEEKRVVFVDKEEEPSTNVAPVQHKIKNSTTTAKNNLSVSPSKLAKQSNKRVNQRAKAKGPRKQCANPDCVYEMRQDSKYCSDECGYAFNKLRYETHFVPKWQLLEKNHSQARLNKMKELDQLERDKGEVETLIRSLKQEKEELAHNIAIIKEQAKKLCKENASSKENEDEDADMDSDEAEEITSGDASKSFCITCGLTIPSDKAFKHWSSCHKKHESSYNFTADVELKHMACKDDENPKLYCNHQDKKTKRYCMNIESACPQHSNWSTDKDEVCGCPVNIMQKLEPDGNYCLELKTDCTQHYHWDKFRLAQINMQRIQAFNRLDYIMDRFDRVTKNLEDTYGGVVGVMLHNTINHGTFKDNPVDNESPFDGQEVEADVDMAME